MKQIMQITGVREYTEICKYEANKIHIRLDLLWSEKKSCEYCASYPLPLVMKNEKETTCSQEGETIVEEPNHTR